MKVKLLTLFLFVSCTEARSSSELRALNQSSGNVQKQNVHERPERCGSILKDSKVEEKHEEFYETSKAQRGKAVTGGSNVNHRDPRSQCSSPLVSSWTSALVLHGSLGLTFLFSFHFF
ncbi:uncharacterized protein LOC129290691 [Prosopis cineraria]|uniref:uncharacterized protein LOC129290691 n=1 Tax=Prosopis cineraria TaxID=364024 RepID=UPI00240F363F|nr:uncharacterized protein LOC129290691 [Prosopis cineraria]